MATTSAPGKGLICNQGSDYYEHLGHFRNKENVAKGHNQGAPSGMLPKGALASGVMAPAGIARLAKLGTNTMGLEAAGKPIRAARVQRRENVMAAKASGAPGAVKAARQQGTANVRLAKGARALGDIPGTGRGFRQTRPVMP